MNNKTAYLTIDDGPCSNAKEKIDFLVSKSIHAVWFLTGKKLEENSEPAIYAIKKGFIIGNHSYTHTKFSNLSLNDCFLEIKTTDRIIESLYKKAGSIRHAKFFRFPYGDKGGQNYEDALKPYDGEGKLRKEKIQKFLRRLGYSQPKFEKITYSYYKKAGLLEDADWYWTYDVMEYEILQKNPRHGIDSIEKVYARIDKNIPEKGMGLNYGGSEDIIMIHGMQRTSKLFIPIIERLLAKGICFKPIQSK